MLISGGFIAGLIGYGRAVIARLRLSRQLRELALIACVAMIGLGVSAHAAFRMIVASEGSPISAPASSVDAAFSPIGPSAAPAVIDRDAAPAPGTTGTTALPDLPIPSGASFDVSDGTVHPARAFSMGRATAQDRDRALQCLASAIYYEAASESDAGQRAVAQVVLNRVMHPAFPDTVCGVVYQGSERATGCQFSFACDGAIARTPMRSAWDKAMGFAAQALAGYVFAPVGLATHYHTYAVTPAWNRNLIMTDAIGAHFFHRWAGYWGTPAAFNQVYRGGEPVPGPYRPATLPGSALTTIATAATALPVSIDPAGAPGAAPHAASPSPLALAMIQPAYVDSGTAKAAPATTDALPQSQVLDKWKDSGQPLR